MNYKQKVIDVLSQAKNMADIELITHKVETTPHINRRTNEGKALTKELLTLINKRGVELMDTNQPF